MAEPCSQRGGLRDRLPGRLPPESADGETCDQRTRTGRARGRARRAETSVVIASGGERSLDALGLRAGGTPGSRTPGSQASDQRRPQGADESAGEVAGVPVAAMYRAQARQLAPTLPAHARRELRRDYNRIVYAKNGIDARKAYDELVAKWTPLAPAVVRSLEEAGNQLLTFYEFPRAMWKSIRTTNALENLNREFRRRTKTQASFSSEESAVALLFGLIASGQIQLRRIDGYQRLSEVLEHAEVAA